MWKLLEHLVGQFEGTIHISARREPPLGEVGDHAFAGLGVFTGQWSSESTRPAAGTLSGWSASLFSSSASSQGIQSQNKILVRAIRSIVKGGVARGLNPDSAKTSVLMTYADVSSQGPEERAG